MLGYEQYCKIKSQYCVCYFGHATQYLVQLKLIRPFIERKLPGLKLTISCRDEYLHWLEDCDFPSRELKARRSEFAFMRELTFDGKNPVENLLDECRIEECVIHQQPITEGHCAIISGQPDEKLMKALSKKHGLVFTNDNWKACESVIGTESAEFYEAAAVKPSILLGSGSRLYKKMFPNSEIYQLGA